MTQKEQFSNEQDQYIHSLMEMLRDKKSCVSANRKSKKVVFYVGCKPFDNEIEISKSDLEHHRLNNTIPTEIQKLL